MSVDTYAAEVECGWGDAVADAWAALEPVREGWRDEDRPVELEDDGYERAEP